MYMGGWGKYIVANTPEVVKGKSEFQNSVSEIRISPLKTNNMKIKKFLELLGHRMAKGEVFLFEWPGICIGGVTLQYRMYGDRFHTSAKTSLVEDFLATAKKSSNNTFFFCSEKGAAIALFDLEKEKVTFVESYKR